jgi:hypothetical protein
MEVTTRVDRLEEALIRLAEAQTSAAEQLEAVAAAQQELKAAQQQTEARLGQLAGAQQQTAAQLAELANTVRALTAAQQRTETQLGALLSWQTGEDGRRRGERLEREVARGAPTLFAGGDGGPPDREAVRRWLAARLVPLLRDGTTDLRPEDDPFYADLIWWKSGTVAVVEVPTVVDEYDVRRAQQRAETLRRAGATAVAAVIGDSWANGEVRHLAAEQYRLAYKVGHEVSDAFIAFRRLPAVDDQSPL